MLNILVDLVTDVFNFGVDLHRPKKARGNEKDKLPSGVEPRSWGKSSSEGVTICTRNLSSSNYRVQIILFKLICNLVSKQA